MPSTQLPYDSKFLPAFKMDIDLNELLDELADLDSVEVMEKGSDAIRKMIEKNTERNITKKDLVIDKLIMYPEESTSAIASLCGCSERYVQQIKKRIKKQ